MKNSIVLIAAAYRFSPSIPMAISLSFGAIPLALSIGSVANAVELFRSVPDQIISQSTITGRSDQEKPTKATSDSNTPPASPISSQLEQPRSQLGIRKDDQVNVEDAPEGCRAYFPPSGSVSLFDYRQGIELCKYGR
ncbi:MAG: hypothetical protein DCF22_14540 [Leptolyngbya sp.]|nr:MAG: hypothetical protein DCF22_14540 [Leptolyngbya sp.]